MKTPTTWHDAAKVLKQRTHYLKHLAAVKAAKKEQK